MQGIGALAIYVFNGYNKDEDCSWTYMYLFNGYSNGGYCMAIRTARVLLSVRDICTSSNNFSNGVYNGKKPSEALLRGSGHEATSACLLSSCVVCLSICPPLWQILCGAIAVP